MVQRAQQHRVGGQGIGQAQPDFAIGEAVALHLRGCQAGGLGQARRGRLFIVEIQQGGRGAHQNSTKTCGTASALPMV